MSTSALIVIVTDSDHKAIYCHNDGYPKHMLPLLRDWYGTRERVEALVGFGDASYIAKRLVPSQDSGHSFSNPEDGVCIFYHRDRGEPFWQVAPCLMTREEVLNTSHDYVYIFEEDDTWHIYSNGKEVSYNGN